MSDPRFRDPRVDPVPLEDDARAQRLNELESSNAMWGWVAGAVVLALVLVFVFTRGQVNDTTAGNIPSPPAVTTGTGGAMQSPGMTQRPRPVETPQPSPAPAPNTQNNK